MGTFTQERLQKVIDGFVLNGQTVSVEPYGNGHINDTFLLIMKEDGTNGCNIRWIGADHYPRTRLSSAFRKRIKERL